MKVEKACRNTLVLLFTMVCFLSVSQTISAKETAINVPGTVYEFEDDDDYPISEAVSSDQESIMGSLVLSGNYTDSGLSNGFQTYTVNSGNLSLSYAFDSSILQAEDTVWHITDDSNKKVDTISLDSKIRSGAVIVQSSKDGTNWITDVQMCDVFQDDTTLSDSFYTTTDIQLANGCYYRVIVVYELQIKTGENTFVVITTNVTEERKMAEVYEFYAVSSETAGNTTSAADTPRKELASKPINTGNNNGYSGNEDIDKDDPHFGWELGTFVINGYTRETDYNGNSVFLKNVGDKVTLWFTLNEDITCLNGDSTLSISEDTKGYDKTFGVKQTNFGHGTLIMSYTDYQGKTHDPVIYTNFLEAVAQTGADTRVQLFEEGDYEVTLDYEIENNPRKLGPVSVFPSYTNYKITFKFSIRNGNCMIYPFDTVTNNELSDNAITKNGFKLDMAKSRYLTIDVEKSVINVGSDGLLTTDVRFSRPAADNDSYTDEGIYTFTVTNIYTGTTVTKTIYVGTDKYLKALSKYGYTVEELNTKISEGYTVTEIGTVNKPAASQ